MKQRIITGAVILIALIVVVIFSWTPVLPVLVALLSAVAVFEMARCIGLHKDYILTVPVYILAIGYPFLMRYMGDTEFLRRVNFIVILSALVYLFAVMTFSHGKYSISDVSVLFTTMFYIVMGFNSILILYCQRGAAGHLLYLTVFIGAWVTDTMAYFCGMLFGRGGKHKLIPDVSPKKTVEGSIGGIVFCVLAMTLFGYVVGQISNQYDAHVWVFAVGGLLAAVVAQMGDLFMSVIKRHYSIKDYGTIFAGHGGVLDRFDSIMAVAIALAAFSSFFDFFKVV